MARYIEAEETINVIRANDWSNPAVPIAVSIIIDRIPSADVAPVVHGKWLPAGLFDDFAKCSACGSMEHSLHEVYRIPHRYCLNCGAKMDLGDKADNREDNQQED